MGRSSLTGHAHQVQHFQLPSAGVSCCTIPTPDDPHVTLLTARCAPRTGSIHTGEPPSAKAPVWPSSVIRRHAQHAPWHACHPYTGNSDMHLFRSLNAGVPAVHRQLRHAPVQVTECRRASHTQAACPPGRPLSGRMPVDSCFRAGSVDKACTACSAHCTRCQMHTCSMSVTQATHCKSSTGQLLQGHFCQFVAQAAQIDVFHVGHLCQHC